MANIADALIVEHRAYACLLDQIEQELVGTRTLEEVQLMARLLEGVLESHGESEEELALAALDHALADRGGLDHLHQDHEEMNRNLLQVFAAKEAQSACRSMWLAVAAVREHFAWEERAIFPMLRRVLGEAALDRLGQPITGAEVLARGEVVTGGTDETAAAVSPVG